MAFCPFLSFKVNSITRSTSNISATVYRNDGAVIGAPPNPTWLRGETTQDAVVVHNTISPNGNDTINYRNTSPFDTNGFFPCPETSACQIWDTENLRCGIKSSDFLYNTTTVQSNAISNVIQGVIGTYIERDGERSIVEWLNNIIGVNTNKDGGRTLLSWLNNIIGINAEKDANNSLYVWAKEIIGKIVELDTTPVHMIGSLLKTKTHIHNRHYHNADPDHSHPGGLGMMKAMVLIAEFVNEQDLDDGRRPEGASGSIFGIHFKITESTAPPAILSIYEHPKWSDPPISITWNEYLNLVPPGG